MGSFFHFVETLKDIRTESRGKVSDMYLGVEALSRIDESVLLVGNGHEVVRNAACRDV